MHRQSHDPSCSSQSTAALLACSTERSAIHVPSISRAWQPLSQACSTCRVHPVVCRAAVTEEDASAAAENAPQPRNGAKGNGAGKAKAEAVDFSGVPLPTSDQSAELLKIRHSCSHLMAMATQRVHKGAQVPLLLTQWSENFVTFFLVKSIPRDTVWIFS